MLTPVKSIKGQTEQEKQRDRAFNIYLKTIYICLEKEQSIPIYLSGIMIPNSHSWFKPEG